MRSQLYTAAALAILAWLFGSSSSSPAAVGLVTKTLEIDDNVNSPTFGEPLSSSATADAANHARLVELVAQSNQAITKYDAANPGALQ